MKDYNLHFTSFGRLLTVLLTVILCFTVVSAPFVHATSVTSVAIGVAGVASASVSVPLALVCLLVVALGAVVVTNVDVIVAKAEEWYQNSAIRNWADKYNGVDLKQGESVVYIPAEVQTAMLGFGAGQNSNWQKNKWLLIPATFLALNALTQDDLLVEQVGDKIDLTNELLTETNKQLGSFKSAMSSAFTSLNELIESLNTSITQVNNNIINSFLLIRDTIYPNINNNIINTFTLLRTKFETLNNNIINEFVLLRSMLPELNTNLLSNSHVISNNITQSITDLSNVSQLITQNVKLAIDDFGTSFHTFAVEYFQNVTDTFLELGNIKIAINDLGESLETKLQSLLDSINFGNSNGGSNINNSFNDNVNNSNKQEDDLINNTGGGKNQSNYIIGQGLDLISKYRVAFLAVGAVFAKFASISFFSDILIISLALGIFALIANLIIQNVSRERSSSHGNNRARSQGG